MDSIFLSYRSSDDAYAAALLDTKLSERFGSMEIFRAGRSIPPGIDYASSLLRSVSNSKVIIAIVGQGWVNSFVKDDSEDWVRMELQEAIGRKIPIIPVLLANARRLVESDLPPSLKILARLQYLRFDYRNIDADSQRIVEALAQYVFAPQSFSSNKNASLSTLVEMIERLDARIARIQEKGNSDHG
ncbi:toll/interleukin-1 receptor domain-containing protein [Actinocorallia aurantiaca]|uniref:TIR domain-containing protein n=1 Tax=Actinocorallia aurantiaca TaxID=46204 RepID=A0ABN3UVG6_9ACTN